MATEVAARAELRMAPTRESATYTACYCEENVWKLCQDAYFSETDALPTGDAGASAPGSGAGDGDSSAGADTASPIGAAPPTAAPRLFAVFISNANMSVVLYSQKLAKAPEEPVVWDYHVVLLELRSEDHKAYIWDFDTTLPFVTPLAAYVRATFPGQSALKEQYRSLFRIVRADHFAAYFASDRSHMRDDKGDWQATPPAYSCVVARDGETMRLDRYRTIPHPDDERPPPKSGFLAGTSVDKDTYGAVVDLQGLWRWVLSNST